MLLAVNGQDVEDVFDYRYMIKDEYIEVLSRKPGRRGNLAAGD